MIHNNIRIVNFDYLATRGFESQSFIFIFFANFMDHEMTHKLKSSLNSD